MFRRKRSVNKKKLEHQLYLARECPEPIFDLSNCDIINVPNGIYSLCRVFLKVSLKLQNNQLSSLSGGGDLKDLSNLVILDLHTNLFVTLPDDIGLLNNLQELYLQDNQLKHLPESLCHLVNLRHLDVSSNRLKDLPENIGNLINLRKLKLDVNPELRRLPKTICKAQKLVSIEVDSERFLYPPRDVVREGTESIMKYICNDTNFDYVSPSSIEDKIAELPKSNLEEDNFEEKIWALERLKMKKMQEFLEIERQNEIFQKKEIEMNTLHKANREKLLASITAQQSKFDDKLSKIHQQRATERFQLIEQLQEAENNADRAINQLLALNREPLTHLLEKEVEEEQRLLVAVNRYNETLKKDEILAAMENILTQETEMFKQFDEARVETSRSILDQELKMDSKLCEILEDHDLHKADLVTKLMEDSDLQKAAVGTLLERGDARSWGLLQELRLVEAQLFALTNIEIDRKKLKMNEHLNDLSEKRITLSVLLIDLLEKQRERRTQLLSILQSMEDHNTENLDDFWLRQYQGLLEKLPKGLSDAQKNIDSKLAELLLMNGVLHCLPFLAKLTQSQSITKNIVEQDLIDAGVLSAGDRIKILGVLQAYSKEHISIDHAPSAPPMLQEEASAPPIEYVTPINALHCVICMDAECQIIFLPCGHLCSCFHCSTLVSDCPLCRAVIERKITIMQFAN